MRTLCIEAALTAKIANDSRPLAKPLMTSPSIQRRPANGQPACIQPVFMEGVAKGREFFTRFAMRAASIHIVRTQSTDTSLFFSQVRCHQKHGQETGSDNSRYTTMRSMCSQVASITLRAVAGRPSPSDELVKTGLKNAVVSQPDPTRSLV